MQVKGSRVARSSNFDDAGLFAVLNQSPTSPSFELRRELLMPPKVSRRSSVSEESPPRILTVSSPEVVKESCYGYGYGQGQGQNGNFLDKCYFCEKRIRQNAEVFMYGSMHGFCTPDCRGKQIVIDSMLERVAKQFRGKATECSRMTDVKDHSGF
ncbi:FCS-Like Zinc finger 16-like isoform X1 [Pistacia vera]|uniref:FCS-Like Zinc finger 16-like isoform X1 n=1 Tax=Pistacia vera TaxID=55513 RepID=UPI0012639523|nr:FCS-Like Zinc finger 16-like isoform X1 [Pistacia vera]